MSSSRVLVTGGSGLIGGHCILQLLETGHGVRATVRSLAREQEVRAALVAAGMPADADLELVAADLTSDDGWTDAMRDVTGVLHVASPVRPGHVEDEDEVIRPAREGALRVLRAARAEGVWRVVMTSAFHAVGWGHPHTDHVFTEDDWTVLDGPGTDAYGRSKTLAERAAWTDVAQAGTGPELVTLLPVAVMGPVIGDQVSGANDVIRSLLQGRVPAAPHVFLPIVDVRDVARAHVLALGTPAAAGQRYLLADGPALELPEIARLLRRELGEAARKVPRRTLPNAVVKLSALVAPAMREIASDLGCARRVSHEKARRELGWVPRDAHEAVLDAGRSMIEKGLVAR